MGAARRDGGGGTIPLEPYFSCSRISLYLGDCRDVLPALSPIGADVVLADPPYGETSLGWDRRVEGWLPIARAALRRNGSLWCFGSFRHFLAERDSFAGWKFAQDLVWEKHNGSNFRADRFRRVHELVAHYYPEDVPWGDIYKSTVKTHDATKKTVRRKERPAHTGKIENSTYVSLDGGPKMMRSVIRVRSCHGYAIHPTQKPTELLEPLIEYSCPPDGLVVVPFAGSGSELQAARAIGRNAVGVELDEAYCEAAAKRLDQAVLSLK